MPTDGEGMQGRNTDGRLIATRRAAVSQAMDVSVNGTKVVEGSKMGKKEGKLRKRVAKIGEKLSRQMHKANATRSRLEAVQGDLAALMEDAAR